MKILLIGNNGQVGWELQRTLNALGEVIATDRKTLDLLNLNAIRETIRSVQPTLIVNAAAYTAVDMAESQPELAMAINGVAPGVIAEEAKKLNCTFVHYSTDYIFDGTKRTPYVESDSPNPLNVYGRSKLAGEQAIIAAGASHLIFRTSWVYSNRGSNFLLTIKRLLREKKELKIVDDQIGAPTSASDIAGGTVKALDLFLKQNQQRKAEMSGIYHLTAAGETSWHGFAAEIISAQNRNVGEIPKLSAIKTHEYPTAARRPMFSVLSNEKLHSTFGLRTPQWKESLKRVLAET